MTPGWIQSYNISSEEQFQKIRRKLKDYDLDQPLIGALLKGLTP